MDPLQLSATTVYRGGFTAPALYVATRKVSIKFFPAKHTIELTTHISVSKGFSTVVHEIGKADYPFFLLGFAQTL